MSRSRNSSTFEKNDKRKFQVVIYEEDYKELSAHVLRKPHSETGGDLFGLWADEYKAAIQLTLGPGQDCRRTSVSFYQDVRYLEKVGSYLTQHEGVCHIGEWHSHHQLGLARPSGGDENTVWNNMPTYKLSKFVIFIANIEASHKSYKVNVGCFLFEIDREGHRLPVLQGHFKILPSDNPFSRKKEVSRNRNSKAEELRSDEKNIEIKDLTLDTGNGLPSVTMKRPVDKDRGRENPNKVDNSDQPEVKKNKTRQPPREAESGGGRSGDPTKVKTPNCGYKIGNEDPSQKAQLQTTSGSHLDSKMKTTPAGGAAAKVQEEKNAKRSPDIGDSAESETPSPIVPLPAGDAAPNDGEIKPQRKEQKERKEGLDQKDPKGNKKEKPSNKVVEEAKSESTSVTARGKPEQKKPGPGASARANEGKKGAAKGGGKPASTTGKEKKNAKKTTTNNNTKGSRRGK